MAVLTSEGLTACLRGGGSVWVLSDVHANLEALEAAADLVRVGDGVVLLGDLLTYGCRPVEVMERVALLREHRDVVLLLGNHDQLYVDLLGGDRAYYDAMPAWIREAADWTLERVDPTWWDGGWTWREELVAGGVLFDHANPEPYGDWTYLNTLDDHERALTTLTGRGLRVGVFGHTHRPKCLVAGADGERYVEHEVDLLLGHGDRAVVNAGSVGQPRNATRRAVVLELSDHPQDGLHLRHHSLDYDVEAHLSAIRGAALSPSTCDKLCSYFAAAP